MPEKLWFLEEPDDHWEQNHEDWERDERRLYGGSGVLVELVAFTSEEPTSFALRKSTARYYNIPDKNMSLLSGHLLRALPPVEFGSMGKVRERRQISGPPSLAEILTYNADGVGQDGTQLRTWIDGVVKRAGATGYRGVLVEMPRTTTLRDIRVRENRDVSGNPSEADRAGGWHPYLVEISPTIWTRRAYTEGTLDMAVIKRKVPSDGVLERGRQAEEDGFYLFVRRGYDRLGSAFQAGGWWVFGQDHRVIDTGDLGMTRGQIPLVRAMAEHNLGTSLIPTIGRSLTMEQGQIAIDLMNARSEQRYNARQAAKTILFGLGMTDAIQREVATQILAGQIVVAIPPVVDANGTKLIPEMWTSSSAALDTQVYSSIISEALAEAREIMLAQVTSVPDSSGASKRAGFDEAVSPLLSRLGGALETWLNSVLAFYAMRAGVKPDATVQMPQNIQQDDVVADIEHMTESMQKAMVSSPRWMGDLMVRQGDELGLIPDDSRADILAEIDASVKRAGDHGSAEYWTKMAAAVSEMCEIPGMTPQGAGYLLGLTPEQVDVLRNGVPPGEVNTGENAAPTEAEKARRAADIAARMGGNGAADGDESGDAGEPPDPEAAARGRQSPAFQRMQRVVQTGGDT